MVITEEYVKDVVAHAMNMCKTKYVNMSAMYTLPQLKSYTEKNKGLTIYVSIETIISSILRALNVRINKGEIAESAFDKIFNIMLSDNLKPFIMSEIFSIAAHYRTFFNNLKSPFNNNAVYVIFYGGNVTRYTATQDEYTANSFSRYNPTLFNFETKFKEIINSMRSITKFMPNIQIYISNTAYLHSATLFIAHNICNENERTIPIIVSSNMLDWGIHSFNPYAIIISPVHNEIINRMVILKPQFRCTTTNYIHFSNYALLCLMYSISYGYIYEVYTSRRMKPISKALAKILQSNGDSILANNNTLYNTLKEQGIELLEIWEKAYSLLNILMYSNDEINSITNELKLLTDGLLDTNIEKLNESVFLNNPVDFKALM